MAMNGKIAFLTAALAAVMVTWGTGDARAAAITGEISMGGLVRTLNVQGGSVVGTATATYLDFSAPTFFGGGTGGFSGIADGTLGSITDFSFSPFVGPIANFWSVAGFTFTLDTIAIAEQDSTFLTLLGSGTVSGNGYAPTEGWWSFTTQNGSTNVFWSATESVPAPGMLGLLGLGLVGLGLATMRPRRDLA